MHRIGIDVLSVLWTSYIEAACFPVLLQLASPAVHAAEAATESSLCHIFYIYPGTRFSIPPGPPDN